MLVLQNHYMSHMFNSHVSECPIPRPRQIRFAPVLPPVAWLPTRSHHMDSSIRPSVARPTSQSLGRSWPGNVIFGLWLLGSSGLYLLAALLKPQSDD